jgi:hypothetical protein
LAGGARFPRSVEARHGFLGDKGAYRCVESGRPVKEDVVPGKKNASIKKPKVYEALRDKGMSKTRAAKISNAKAKKK